MNRATHDTDEVKNEINVPKQAEGATIHSKLADGRSIDYSLKDEVFDLKLFKEWLINEIHNVL